MKAAVEIVDARFAHQYSTEIAQAMLQRQQAGAIGRGADADRGGRGLDGRDGASSSSKRGIVELDAERKAAMVSNLLVVLCGERGAQPIVNAGTLY